MKSSAKMRVLGFDHVLGQLEAIGNRFKTEDDMNCSELFVSM